MSKDIELLITEGQCLENTFVEDPDDGQVLSSDSGNISKWLTKCLRVVERVESEGTKSPLYSKFATSMKNISYLSKESFLELIGILQGINETIDE